MKKLSHRQAEILRFLIENPDEDIMIDGNTAYFGDEPTSIPMVYSLLRLCVISQDSYSDLRFHINETGRNALK